MTEHYNVAIATPGRSFHAEYVKSLVNTCRELSRLGITYTFLNRYSSFVASAREMTATDSGTHSFHTNKIAEGRFTCDKIFWIDSDIDWQPKDFLELYYSNEDIISGLYALDAAGLVAANIIDENGLMKSVDYRYFILDADPVSVGGVGFGFVCVKASVWESIPQPWFLIVRAPFGENKTMVNVSEDYSWCARARHAGFDVKVHPLVKVNHHKEVVYRV